MVGDAGMPRVNSGISAAFAWALLAVSGTGDAFDGALAQFVAEAGKLLLGAVGEQGRHRSGHAGDEPETEADAGTAGHGGGAAAPFRPWGAVSEFRGRAPGGFGVLAVGQDLGEPEDADDDGHEADAVQEPVHAKGEAGCAGNRVDADHGDQQAQGSGDNCFHHRFAGQGNEQGYADDHEGEEFRRADEQAQVRPGAWRQRPGRRVAMVPPTKEPMAAMVSAAPALPIFVIA
jgi:hypothetical protein